MLTMFTIYSVTEHVFQDLIKTYLILTNFARSLSELPLLIEYTPYLGVVGDVVVLTCLFFSWMDPNPTTVSTFASQFLLYFLLHIDSLSVHYRNRRVIVTFVSGTVFLFNTLLLLSPTDHVGGVPSTTLQSSLISLRKLYVFPPDIRFVTPKKLPEVKAPTRYSQKYSET